MNIERAELERAAAQGLIEPEQIGPLWQFLAAGSQAQAAVLPSFRFTHILYYLGGLLAIGAMSLFMTLGWQRFGGWALCGIALAYGAAGLLLTEGLLRRQRLEIPAGITATFVVTLVPLAIYGLQAALGWWAPMGEGGYHAIHVRIDWRWLYMELGTLAVAALLLRRYRLPFLVMPVAVTLWYLSMDLTPMLYGDDPDWQLRKLVSLIFGLLMIGLAFVVDLRTRSARDYAFWLYLYGVLAFWGGLSLMDSDSELGKFIYLCINLLLLGVGAVLVRRVFAVFGALGAAGYVGHLAHQVFKDSLLFPFALTALGFGVIGLGILWQRHEAGIAARLRALLPAALQALLQRRQA